MSQTEHKEYKVNVSLDTILDNVRHSITLGLPQCKPHDLAGKTIGIACGGYSLKEQLPYIKERREAGMPLITTNGTHDYMLENDIIPSAHVQLDARPFMTRFVENWRPYIRYLIASQSHADVFETLKDAPDVHLFHCVAKPEEVQLLEDYYFGHYYQVPGGGTVGLRTIMLMRMLGYDKMELFGFDSCYMGDEHHAFEQEENDKDSAIRVKVHGREFVCAGWMHAQAVDFLGMVKVAGHLFKLRVHGDGLIAHLLETGASLNVKED